MEQDTPAAQAPEQAKESGQVQSPQDERQVKPFTADQEQYMQSWMGRVIKKHVDEAITPLVRQQQQQQPPMEQDAALKQFNEKVQEKLFSGDAVGAMDMVLNLKERAKQNVTQTQNLNLLRGLTTFSDQPYYEDIQPDMQKLARQKVSEGWPVDAALKASYSEAKASFLETKLTGNKDHGNLGLSGGGRQSTRKNEIKLTPEFEKACARDISDGLYKNRDEWVKGLSPKVRERMSA
jgi:hypothetical protein